MTVILVPIIASLGVGALLPMGIMAGAFVILFGIAKLGRLIERIPWSVMEGFTLGIALVIAWQQIELISPFTGMSVALVVATLAIKLLWSRYHRRNRWTRRIPASAVAVILVTGFSTLLGLTTSRIGEIPASEIFALPNQWTHFDFVSLLGPAISIAVLASLESLLAARVADSLAHAEHRDQQPQHDPNRELIGQGLATIGSALVGGMPATGAIARTAVNVHAGAKTKLAAATHAVVLLGFVFLLAPLVSLIPIAALAGVLLGTSWRIANPRTIRESLQTTWPNVFSYVVTAVAVFVTGLMMGIVIGALVYVACTFIEKRRATRS